MKIGRVAKRGLHHHHHVVTNLESGQRVRPTSSQSIEAYMVVHMVNSDRQSAHVAAAAGVDTMSKFQKPAVVQVSGQFPAQGNHAQEHR